MHGEVALSPSVSLDGSGLEEVHAATHAIQLGILAQAIWQPMQPAVGLRIRWDSYFLSQPDKEHSETYNEYHDPTDGIRNDVREYSDLLARSLAFLL